MLNGLMLDDPREAAQPVDDARLNHEEQICHWAGKLGVSAGELRSALEEIAPLAHDR
jgi:hypothetical protein